MSTNIEVTYRGVPTKLAERVRGLGRSSTSVRDSINLAGWACLGGNFADLAPGYPKFASLVTNEDRPQAAQEAMRWTSGSIQTKQGASVLDALDLLDRSRLDTKQSRYAKHICRNCWLRRGRARSLTATK